MAQYSYPLLQSDEILTVLRELTIDATSDDLINPTPQKVHVVFSQLVELLRAVLDATDNVGLQYPRRSRLEVPVST